MAEAAFAALPYPETAVIEAETLAEQTLTLASELPARPIVLGGCCCAHVGAIEALAAGGDRLAVVWLDAHGDLNTPASSPSGNAWGMPLRMVVDDGAVLPTNVALVGARSLDPPEREFIDHVGIRVGENEVGAALEGADAVYVAFDGDVVEPGELAVFMSEPGGLHLMDVERLFARLATETRVAGFGCTGLVSDPANESPLTRLAAALGL